MTLRTAGLIAGVLGVLLLAVGLVAQAVKPAAEATPSAHFETTVVVVPPEIVALSPDAVLTISGSSELAAHTARNEDVPAWTASRGSVTITGLNDWEALTVTSYEPLPSPEPSVSPSGSPSPSASASPKASASASPKASPTASPAAATSNSASASPSPAASGSAEPSATPVVSPTPQGSQDIWRNTAQQSETYEVKTAELPPGLTLVVEALDGGSISSASLAMSRTIDDDWISQVLWWGAALAAIGLIALIALFVDVRPAQSKGEEWLAGRTAVGHGRDEAAPGSRRARRQSGSAMPVATIPGEPTTGSIPVVIEAQTASTEVPMVAVTGGVPTVRPAAPEPSAEHFEPPQTEPLEPHVDADEEDRS